MSSHTHTYLHLYLHLGFVHQLRDVALHQCLPLSFVCGFPNPGGSLLLCYVILPSSAWSSSRPLPSPWLPLCASLCPPIVLCYMTGPFPLLCQCVFYDIDDLCSFFFFFFKFLSIVCYLLASGLTFSFLLLFERFSVCLSFVYLETMFGSHRSWLARYIGPILVFQVKWGVVYPGVFPWFFFSKTAPRCSDSGIYFFFSGVFGILSLFQLFADLSVCLRCPHGLSCTLSSL